MKIKINRNEASALCMLIAANGDRLNFVTKFEADLSTAILKVFATKLTSTVFSGDKSSSFKIAPPQMLVLQHILPQCVTSDPFELAVQTTIINQIDQACLSI